MQITLVSALAARAYCTGVSETMEQQLGNSQLGGFALSPARMGPEPGYGTAVDRCSGIALLRAVFQ